MSILYSLSIRWKAKIKRVRLLLLEVLSLSVVFYFALMFVCKLVDTHGDIAYYRSRTNVDEVVYQLEKAPEAKISDVDFTLYQKADQYVTVHSKTYKAQVIGIDQNFSSFYHDHLFQNIVKKKALSHSDAILSQSVAREMSAKEGDTLTLNHQVLKIIGITDDPWWKGKVAVSFSILPASELAQPKSLYLTIRRENVELVENQLSVLDQTDLAQSLQNEINSLRAFQRFLLSFSAVFFLIAGCNLMLILRTRFRRERGLHQILYLCGETRGTYYLASMIDGLTMCISSDFIALLIYRLMRPFVPSFFYFALTPTIYGLEMLMVAMISIIITLIFSHEQAVYIRMNERKTHAV